jgi:hypothetical protein
MNPLSRSVVGQVLRSAAERLKPDRGGWSCPVPYMHVKEVRDLCLYKPLQDTMTSLIGDRIGLGWDPYSS